MEIDNDDKMTIKQCTKVKTAQKLVRLTLGLFRKAPTDEVKLWLGLESLVRVFQSGKGDLEDICEG